MNPILIPAWFETDATKSVQIIPLKTNRPDTFLCSNRHAKLISATIALFTLFSAPLSHASLVEYFKLKNLYTNFCLLDNKGKIDEPTGTNTGFSSAAYTWNDAVDERRAHWYAKDAGSGSVYIINRYSGRKLKYSDTQTSSSNKTLLYASNSDNSADARWKFVAEGAHFHIENANRPGYYLYTRNNGDVEIVTNTTYTRTDWDKEMLPAGASTPFTKYDEDKATGYVSMFTNVASDLRASEADNNASLYLPPGKGVQWTATAPANGLTLRYSLNDATNGGGTNTSIVIRNLTTSNSVTVPLTSKYAWLYGSEYSETNDPSAGEARRVFDHTRVKIEIHSNDNIRIDHGNAPTSAPPVWIDFFETEVIPVTNSAPAGATIATNSSSILTALTNATNNAVIFVPAGTYIFTNALQIRINLTLLGAGMWHTTFEFTNTSAAAGALTVGGIYVYNNAKLTARNFNMNGPATFRGEGGTPFNSWSGFGNNSLIDSVSWSHLSVARFHGTDDMRVQNCRAYDISAGGIINMGSSDRFIADNNIVRHSCDDGMATWSSTSNHYNYAYECRYNTVEFTARGGGISLYGGEQAVIYNNLIRNNLPASHAAFRVTSTFAGAGFATNTDSVFMDNIIEDSKGDAQIYFIVRDYNINNVMFFNNTFTGADYSTEGIVKVFRGGTNTNYFIRDIVFENLNVDQGRSIQPMYNVVNSGINGNMSFIDCTRTSTVPPNTSINNSGTDFVITTNNCIF